MVARIGIVLSLDGWESAIARDHVANIYTGR